VPIEVPDTWQVLLELNNDLLVTVLANNSAVGSKAPQLELYGLNGTIAVDLLDVSAPVELLRGGQWQQVAVQHEREKGPDHLLGVEHLVDCIEQGSNPLPSIDHAIHVLEVIEAAGRSAKNGRRIQLTTAI
jgi:predicted dehydrogenase